MGFFPWALEAPFRGFRGKIWGFLKEGGFSKNFWEGRGNIVDISGGFSPIGIKGVGVRDNLVFFKIEEVSFGREG